MTLEKYCDRRLIVLPRNTSAHDAARAMDNNHIGAVLVGGRRHLDGIVTDRDLALRVVGQGLDPKKVRIGEVMTGEPASIDLDATEEQAAALMAGMHVRRLVVMDGDRLAGLVTLDDLVMAGSADKKQLRDVIYGQLSEEAPAKPEGFTYPVRARREPERAARRRRARRQQTMAAFLTQLENDLHLGSRLDALKAFEIVTSALVRRLTASEANDFAAQLPQVIKDRLLDQPTGPDRKVTRASIEAELSRRLELESDAAAELATRVGRSLSDFVSPGELADVRAQLPSDLARLIPRAA